MFECVRLWQDHCEYSSYSGQGSSLQRNLSTRATQELLSNRELQREADPGHCSEEAGEESSEESGDDEEQSGDQTETASTEQLWSNI